MIFVSLFRMFQSIHCFEGGLSSALGRPPPISRTMGGEIDRSPRFFLGTRLAALNILEEPARFGVWRTLRKTVGPPFATVCREQRNDTITARRAMNRLTLI